jgi:hypothetical protein
MSRRKRKKEGDQITRRKEESERGLFRPTCIGSCPRESRSWETCGVYPHPRREGAIEKEKVLTQTNPNKISS